jgi:aryl-alcohol dehydrogenase-like predicted oxidoreductase
VPLASGLLSGKYSLDTEFAANDHRNYNRPGASFDVGETFSGVDFDQGLNAVKSSRDWRQGVTTALAAIAGLLRRTASAR